MPRDSSLLKPNSSPLGGPGEESAIKGQEWKAAAARIAGKGKVSQEEMEAVVLELSSGRHLTLAELSGLLRRASASLRNKTLTPMIRAGRLRYIFPDTPNRPDQAYTAASSV